MSEKLREKDDAVLIVGSSPDALRYKAWSLTDIKSTVVINNAWKIRDEWDFHIYPEDFPSENQPKTYNKDQRAITYKDYVPAQNLKGGVVYAGATMAFTAAYWALVELRPSIIAFVGCDMVYPNNQQTHFYGSGQPDPLRKDISLQNLEAKSTRLQVMALEEQCLCINLSSLDESRLVFPSVNFEVFSKLKNDKALLNSLYQQLTGQIDLNKVTTAKNLEKKLGYFVENGEYWNCLSDFSWDEIQCLDQLWLSTMSKSRIKEDLATEAASNRFSLG
jgi:hypothetical protein